MVRQRTWKSIALATAAIVAVAVLQLQAAPASFLWKAAGPRGGSIFLAGSIHLMSSEISARAGLR